MHKKINDIRTLKYPPKRIHWKYSTKETNNRNNDMPIGTEDKVYIAVVSLITKFLPDEYPRVAETCCHKE
jgi:hypothetical protein